MFPVCVKFFLVCPLAFVMSACICQVYPLTYHAVFANPSSFMVSFSLVDVKFFVSFFHVFLPLSSFMGYVFSCMSCRVDQLCFVCVSMELLKRFCSWLQLNYVDGSECKLSLSHSMSLSPRDECRPSPFKRVLYDFQDMKDGLSSISKPSSDEAAFQFQRTWSHNSVYLMSEQKTDGVCTQEKEQSCWATMHPELLRHIMHKVDEGRSTWPSRKDVLACASVCRSWREATKDAVKCLELSGRLTFPISLKQPGPRNSVVQCVLKRDRSNSTFYLYISSTTKLTESGKFLLAARKYFKATSWDYIISVDANDFSPGGHNYVGKLRSNFLGTKFTIHESPSDRSTLGCLGKDVGPNQFSYQSLSPSFNVAHISYDLNVLGINGPRRMQCILHSVPVSCLEEGRSAHSKDSSVSLHRFKSTGSTDATESELVNESIREDAPLMLKNKLPRWHEQLECWCLNFKGRVTFASVKNFQLVAVTKSLQDVSPADYDQVLLQFGKVGKDIYTMDYKYPLSAFQAFAICLSSFDTKGAVDDASVFID